ncbi:MAG: glycosyltransferase family 4 protein [Deinococcales bacterium]
MNQRPLKIALIDPYYQGHHCLYALQLVRELVLAGHRVYALGHPHFVEALKDYSERVFEIELKPSVKGLDILAKRQFLLKSFSICQDLPLDIVHLLYLDRFITPLYFAKHKTLSFKRVCATLHWGYFLPQFLEGSVRRGYGGLEHLLLKRLIQDGLIIMTHSHSLIKSLAQPRLSYVPYPAEAESHPKTLNLREQLKLKTQDKLLLAFGGTRYDKGVDLAIKALAGLDDDIHLLIAGKAEDFDAATLTTLIQQHQLETRVHLHLNFIPDAQTPSYFEAADAVLLPYRHIFAGQSGPLTLAAVYERPVISSDSPMLKESIEAFKLGESFPSENISEMQRAIKQVLKGNYQRTADFSGFRISHSPANFARAVMRSYLLS